MLTLWIKFSLGVMLLLVSTHAFVKFAEKISWALRISPLIVGTTLVALGTSLPELAVSTIAVLKNDAGLAIGNIVGSNIINVFMVLPAGILIGKLRIGTNKTQRNALVLIGATFIFLIVQALSLPAIFSGLLLIGLAISFTIEEYRWGVFGRTHEDFKAVNHHKKGFSPVTGLASLIFSLIGIIVGGVLVVTSVESLSYISGYSTTILGLSLTAIVTSSPELLTTFFSQEDDQEKLTIGNILGSNIYNLLFIGGVATFFGSKSTILAIDWLWLIGATVLFVAILKLYKGNFIPKWLGVFLLFLFIAYLFILNISRT